ncbi:trans-sulfuration enzyme family protein [Actinophytocola sp. NPDC049390]|uniref:trans-sulfuration enzyme family protein n=1 Tax=Actinophytocola sp. NPDC049390 TaxID=3363894 RepID=UPI00379A44CC
MRFDTLAVHGGERVPGPEGSVVFPIFQGTVFTSEPGESYHDIKYHRLNSTPSQTYLHDKLAALEGAQAAVATSSGMAAVTTILHTLLGKGDHLLVGDVLYGGTHDFVTGHAERLGWEYTVIDPHDPSSWAVRDNTKAVLVETITNPMMRVGRLREVVAFAREHGLVSVVDNTFASPVNFRPVVAGFDLVFNSATKYLNGHSDVVAGAVAGSAELVEKVRHTQNLYGGSLDPHAGYLLARSLKTLGVRVRQQNANALALATFLAESPKIAGVNHPGLATHPDHEHARELLSGFGGMLSFRLAGGVAAAEEFMAALTLPAVAPSLGGVETLITRPAVTSHAGMSPEDRVAVGITDDLIRLSVGIEDVEDLLGDFAQALDKM